MVDIAPSPTFAPRDVIANYELVTRIAQGGMGDVHLAVQRASADSHAGAPLLAVVKELRAGFADEPAYVRMFLDEARLAERLAHPNIVRTLEVGADGARYFIALEHLDGQPLHRIFQRLGRAGALTLPMQIRILADVLAGLHHAHEACDESGAQLGVVHRDVTPQNVIVTYDGRVKILDFGIAKTLESEKTRVGVVKGKIGYMAPEQALGAPVDRRTDVFSAGIILWEALAGRRLWKGAADVTVLVKLVNEPIPCPRAVNAAAPEALANICRRAVARAKDDRYPTADAMRQELEAYLAGFPDAPSRGEIGALLARAFADERVALRRVVGAVSTSAPAGGSAAAPLVAQSPSQPPSQPSHPPSRPSPPPSRPSPPPSRPSPPPSRALPPPSQLSMATALALGALAFAVGAAGVLFAMR